MNAAEPLLPHQSGYWDAIKCPMSGCTEDLYMCLDYSTPLMVGSTAEDLADPDSACSQSWEVRCSGGHVVVLPADTAADDYTFGDNPEDNDIERLSATTGWKP